MMSYAHKSQEFGVAFSSNAATPAEYVRVSKSKARKLIESLIDSSPLLHCSFNAVTTFQAISRANK